MSVQASVLEAIDLCEERLHEPLRMAEAAAAAGYSVYHFCRVFSQTTRLTPYEYLMRRRLSQAAEELLHTQRRVLDIALDYQFGSSEAFGRAFQRMFGVLPSRLRQRGHLDARLLLPRFTGPYLAALTGLCLRPEKTHREAIELWGWMAPGTPGGVVFTRLWQRACDEFRHAGHGANEHRGHAEECAHLGILFYPHDWQDEGCFCFAGLHLPDASDQPPLLAKACVRAQAYACFACESEEEDLGFLVAHLFHSWLPHSGLDDLPGTILFEQCGPRAWLIFWPLDA